jgi:hypothetical protein
MMDAQTTGQKQSQTSAVQVLMDAYLSFQHVWQLVAVSLQHFAPVRGIVPWSVPHRCFGQWPRRMSKVKQKIGGAYRSWICVRERGADRGPGSGVNPDQMRGPVRLGKAVVLCESYYWGCSGARAGGSGMTGIGKRTCLYKTQSRKACEIGLRKIGKFRLGNKHNFQRVPGGLARQV